MGSGAVIGHSQSRDSRSGDYHVYLRLVLFLDDLASGVEIIVYPNERSSVLNGAEIVERRLS